MEQLKLELSNTRNSQQLAKLAQKLLYEQKECASLTEQISMLLDAGLDINETIDGEPWFWELLYIENPYQIKIAKTIFERCGMPTVKCDGESFFEFLQSKIDYYDFNNGYLVKLFLLSCAYVDSVESLSMSEYLYPEMFDYEIHYSGKTDVDKNSQPLKLTKEIFKDIDDFDWCIEMEEQLEGYYGCWCMHIYDKWRKIKVATYHTSDNKENIDFSKKSETTNFFNKLIRELKNIKIKSVTVLNDGFSYDYYNTTYTTDESIYIVLDNGMCLVVSYPFIDKLNIKYRKMTPEEEKRYNEMTEKDLFNYDYEICSAFTGERAIWGGCELEYGYIEKILLEPVTEKYGKLINDDIEYVSPNEETFNEIKFIMSNGKKIVISAADAFDDGYTKICSDDAETIQFRRSVK